jgi:lipopolysaccharide transport system ATP-binding protein
LTMHKILPAAGAVEAPAIAFSNVSKKYRLYGSLRDQALDVLGIRSLFSSATVTEFGALKNINVIIGKGEQVGIVGRNGAGKTTMLKMLTGNFAPTAGEIAINGTIQALMQTGLGFHPDFTGEENLRSALAYNGLTGAQFDVALADAIDFVELDQFLQQPFRTYSLGMRSRLQFAAATAIHPDILIVDEVLGAGDAYFSGKSAARMKRLTSGGCTLLLVSHSMQQVLQFCQRCIWLEAGEIVMEGPALTVVRAYEEYTRRLEAESAVARAQGQVSVLSDEGVRGKILAGIRQQTTSHVTSAAELDATNVSRWPTATDELRISKVRLRDSKQVSARIVTAGEPASFELDVTSTNGGLFRARFVFVLNREDGFVAARLISDYMEIDLLPGVASTVCASVPTIQLGGGRYVASAAIYKNLELDEPDAVAYDLISRCFEFEVIPMHRSDTSLLYQPHQWMFRKDRI